MDASFDKESHSADEEMVADEDFKSVKVRKKRESPPPTYHTMCSYKGIWNIQASEIHNGSYDTADRIC
jgi:hypothetical protein